MMENAEIVAGWDEYRARIEPLVRDREKPSLLISYADYFSATFGVKVLPAPSSLPEDPKERREAFLAASAAPGQHIVFHKFGRPLSHAREQRKTGEEMLAEAEARPESVGFSSPDGTAYLVDYAGSSESGSCIVLALSKEAYAASARHSKPRFSRAFSGLEWWYVLGYMEPPFTSAQDVRRPVVRRDPL